MSDCSASFQTKQPSCLRQIPWPHVGQWDETFPPGDRWSSQPEIPLLDVLPRFVSSTHELALPENLAKKKTEAFSFSLASRAHTYSVGRVGRGKGGWASAYVLCREGSVGIKVFRPALMQHDPDRVVFTCTIRHSRISTSHFHRDGPGPIDVDDFGELHLFLLFFRLGNDLINE